LCLGAANDVPGEFERVRGLRPLDEREELLAAGSLLSVRGCDEAPQIDLALLLRRVLRAEKGKSAVGIPVEVLDEERA